MTKNYDAETKLDVLLLILRCPDIQRPDFNQISDFLGIFQTFELDVGEQEIYNQPETNIRNKR